MTEVNFTVFEVKRSMMAPTVATDSPRSWVARKDTAQTEIEVKLTSVIKEIQLDVVQVQQWLTDISATRGLDGLDDGFEAAAEYAEKFAGHVEEARELATALELQEVLDTLARTEAAFGPYYDVGRRMAQAYVDQGPAGGNAMMAAFDEEAEAIGEQLEALLESTNLAVSAQIDALTEDIETLRVQDRNTTLIIVTISALAVLLAGLSLWILISTVSSPVRRMTAVMHQLATGDHQVEIPYQAHRDEIGEMAGAVKVFRENAIENQSLQETQAEERRRAEEEKRRAMQALASEFESSVKGVVESVSSAAGQLQATAKPMVSSAGETGERAQAVSAATEQAANNVQTVAAASEELSSSIAEIGRQVAQSSQIAGRAVEEVEGTNATVLGLAESVQKIGEVVELISDIAEQTNLLALNATIEAARAGEAGKGFAVVANEVKALATQTAQATDDITHRIGAIQNESRQSVEAIEGIRGVIGQLNEIATAIASAVEEQAAATQEISRNVQEAAEGTQAVSSNIAGVNQAACDTGEGAAQVLDAAGALTRQSDSLKAEVERFLTQVRAA